MKTSARMIIAFTLIALLLACNSTNPFATPTVIPSSTPTLTAAPTSTSTPTSIPTPIGGGRGILYFPANLPTDLYLMDVSTKQSKLLSKHDGANGMFIALSKDNQYIAYFISYGYPMSGGREFSEIYLYEIASGNSKLLYKSKCHSMYYGFEDIVWDPDGKYVYFDVSRLSTTNKPLDSGCRKEFGINRIDLATGETQLLAGIESRKGLIERRMDILPDGSGILLGRTDGVYFLDLKLEKPAYSKLIDTNGAEVDHLSISPDGKQVAYTTDGDTYNRSVFQDETPIAISDVGVSGIKWSASGKYILLLSAHSRISIWSEEEEKLVSEMNIGGCEVYSADWSPDEQAIGLGISCSGGIQVNGKDLKTDTAFVIFDPFEKTLIDYIDLAALDLNLNYFIWR